MTTSTTGKIHILIPDGNSTWALPVIKCLAARDDFKIYVLSTKKRTPVKYSKTTFYYKYYPQTDDVSWLKILNEEIEANHIKLVLPIAEPQSLFLIQNINDISKQAKVVPLASQYAFETAIDKYKLGIFCETHQIPYPKSKKIKNYQDYADNGHSLNYPLLIKPLHDKGGNGIVLFRTPEKLREYLFESHNPEGLFIQEYIEGYDIDCSVLCRDGKILTHTIQKGFLSGINPYAPYLGIEFLENDEVLKLTGHLMADLNWSGVAHIDLRYDLNSKSYKILEVNARFWGSVEASKESNINFPVLVCNLALGNDVIHIPYEPIQYLRFRGLLKFIKQHPSYIFNIKSILNSTEAKAVLKDPLPTLYKFIEWCGRQFQV